MSYSDLSYFFLNDALQIQVAMIKKKVVTHQNSDRMVFQFALHL